MPNADRGTWADHCPLESRARSYQAADDSLAFERFLAVETAALDLSLGNEASLALGLMFVLGSLLCRHGAELTAGGGADA